MKRTAGVSLLALLIGGLGGYGIGRSAPSPTAPSKAQKGSRESPPAPVVGASCQHSDPPRDPAVHDPPMYEGGLAKALSRFKETAGTEEGDRWADLLARVRDPAVEEIAFELLRSGVTAQQLAGLDLLDRLNIENPDTRRLLLDLLRNDPRPEILGGALYALHPCVTDPRESRMVVSVLTPLAAHPDSEVRRRAVLSLAQWGRIGPALGALQDPSPDVRAGAAFALGETGMGSREMGEALAARVADEREDWAVRETAWRSLSRFPLDERTYEVYRVFRECHEAAGEIPEPDEPSQP